VIPAVLLALALAADPAGAPPGRLRLERLEAPGLEPGLVEAVEAGLCAALAEASGQEATCPADLAAGARLIRQSVMLGGTTSEEGLRRLEAAEAAARLVRGALSRQPTGYRLRLALTGPSGAVAHAEAELPAPLDALLARLPALARGLLQ
jgi:hypothetical protein